MKQFMLATILISFFTTTHCMNKDFLDHVTVAAKNIDLSSSNAKMRQVKQHDYSHQNISRRRLCFTNLARKNFSQTDARKSRFDESDLHKANFEHANLLEASFTQTDLTGTSFVGADLKNVSFSGADLSGANFQDADLTGADFSSCIITETTNFKGAILNEIIVNNLPFETLKFLLYTHRSPSPQTK